MIKIEIDNSLDNDEIIIRCNKLTDSINEIENKLNKKYNNKLATFKNNTEYYLNIDTILFFETNSNIIDVHTTDEVYNIKITLYELEEILPNTFTRVSKSTILNIDHIYSINKSLASSNIVQFNKSHKKVYVSRFYYKILKVKLREGR